LKKNDWDVIVAHFLGVDHCGHKYGPVHSEMSRKLSEMNEIIKHYANEIDDDTMLLVIGDHGMTKTGDHGGSSQDEVEALLFAYSKKMNFIPTEYDDNIDFIQQIDLAPTLATILGIPIPFSNLGTISLQLLPDVSFKNLQLFQVLSAHLWHNAKQIQKYFTLYAKEHDGTFSVENYDEIESNFEGFRQNLRHLKSEDEFKEYARELKSNMDKVLELCRNIWIEFNPRLMSQGMLIAFLGIFAAFILINNIPLEEFAQIFNKKVVTFQLISSVFIAACSFFFHSELGWSEAHIALLFMTSVWNAVIFAYIIIQNWATIADEMHKVRKISNLIPRISYAFSIGIFFSNSFVIYEQKILCFLLTIQFIYFIYEIRSTTKIADFKGVKMRLNLFFKSTFSKILIVTLVNIFLMRLSYGYFKCREEQGNCWDFMLSAETQNETQKKMNLLPVAFLAITVTVIRIFLKTNGNLTGFAPHVLIIKFGTTLSVIAACGHLILTQKQDHRPIVSNINLDMLAWIVYGVFLIEICAVITKPLLVYAVPRRNDEHLNVSNYNNMIPELYRHIRNVFNEGHKSGSVRIPIIYGLATVYSSIFIAFGTIFAVVLSLLLGVDITNGFLIIFTVAFGCLFVSAILCYESANTIKDCLQPKFSLIVTWYLLYCYGFYCTSHQPTISQIDWNAAFVGRASNFDNNNIVSAVLVLLSTFNANFLLLIMYPLMVLFPFMIYAIFPNLSMSSDKKNKDDSSMEYRKVTLNEPTDEATSANFDITRGEINLYENEKLFLSSAFKIGTQLIILQGTKALASMIACTILCRHLMVWKIFAPRFIYEGISSYISFVVIVCGFMLLLRIHAAVKALIYRVNKKS
jgi:GPI ethanolamine phosphate transferase 3 subunit O